MYVTAELQCRDQFPFATKEEASEQFTLADKEIILPRSQVFS